MSIKRPLRLAILVHPLLMVVINTLDFVWEFGGEGKEGFWVVRNKGKN